MSLDTEGCPQQKEYDYLLKFLLVGDSDVGKQEMLNDLEDGSSESPYCSGSGNDVYPISNGGVVIHNINPSYL